MMKSASLVLLLLACTVALSGAGVPPSEVGGQVFDPAAFVQPQENPYFPLRPGTVYHYRSVTEDGVETSTFHVTHQKKTIMGVQATVIHDSEYVDGDLVEDTFDWYATDMHGNVWYFGEDTAEIEDGEVVSTSGSWEAGQDGALPGIVMLSDPVIGVTYREEFRPGQAEDKARVVGLNKRVKAPSSWPYVTTTWPFTWTIATPPTRTFAGVLKTRNWNPLDPGGVEWKYYAPGVGAVLEVERDEDGEFTRKRLVNVTTP